MIKSMDEEASAAINAMKAGEAAVQGLPAPPAQAQAPAAQNPGAPTARAAQMRTERDAVAARAREALADPMLPPEAKAHVRQMLSELEAQEGQLAEVENQAHSMEASMAGEGDETDLCLLVCCSLRTGMTGAAAMDGEAGGVTGVRYTCTMPHAHAVLRELGCEGWHS